MSEDVLDNGGKVGIIEDIEEIVHPIPGGHADDEDDEIEAVDDEEVEGEVVADEEDRAIVDDDVVASVDDKSELDGTGNDAVDGMGDGPSLGVRLRLPVDWTVVACDEPVTLGVASLALDVLSLGVQVVLTHELETDAVMVEVTKPDVMLSGSDSESITNTLSRLGNIFLRRRTSASQQNGKPIATHSRLNLFVFVRLPRLRRLGSDDSSPTLDTMLPKKLPVRFQNESRRQNWEDLQCAFVSCSQADRTISTGQKAKTLAQQVMARQVLFP